MSKPNKEALGTTKAAKKPDVSARNRALQEQAERLAAEQEKTARLRALREERDRRVGALVKKALNRKPGQAADKPKPLASWLDEQEKFGRGR